MKRNKATIPIIACIALTSCTQEVAPQKYTVPKSFNNQVQVALSDAQLKQMKFSSIVAKTESIPVEIEASGEIEVNPTLSTPALSLVPGRIESVHVQIGDHVRKGQVLASVRSEEVAQIESQLIKTIIELRGEKARLDAEKKFAKATYDRKQLLFNEGINPKAELQAAETELAKSTAALENLEYKRKAEIETTSERLRIFGLPNSEVDRLLKTDDVENSFDILSPRSGIVTERQVDPGQTISTSDKLFEVSDLSQVWLTAQVFEKDVEAMHMGEPVTVMVDGLPDKTFGGKVDYVGAEMDEQSRTLPVRADVDNRSNLLKPKMFARLKVRTAKERILAIPQRSVQKVGESYVVYVAVGPQTYLERQVQVGKTLGDSIEISSGLRPGETVVVDGSLQLQGLAIEQSKQ